MVYGDALKSYHHTSISTADTLKLIIMCYDAVIKDLEKAKEFHQKHMMDQAYEKLRHAQDLVTELLLGLDYARGGEIAANLHRIYNFMLRQMIKINSRQDTDIYDHLIHIMAELREAWEEIRHGNIQPVSTGMPSSNRTWESTA